MIQKHFIRSAAIISSVGVLLAGCSVKKAEKITSIKTDPPPVIKQEIIKPVAVNLALKQTITASSFESDEHFPAKAVDGSTEEGSRWCASDGEVPQWIKVDLGKASTINGAEITWEFDGKSYLYALEGSADGEKWATLADRTTPTLQKSTAQVQKLEIPQTPDIKYVRVRITSLEEGAWASITELKVLGW